MFPQRSPRDEPSPRFTWIVIAVLLAPSLVWILRDRSVWQGDTAEYGTVSTDLWLNLGHSMRTWAKTMDIGLYFKPPGLVWAAQFFVPLHRVFPSLESALLLCILITQALTLLIVFRIGTRLIPGSRLAAAAGCVFAASSQLFVAFSHLMLVEPLQTLASAWAWYLAVRAPEWPKARIASHLVSVGVLGMLAKVSTPVYFAVPVAYCCYYLFLKPGVWDLPGEWKVLPSRITAIACGILLLPCMLWYYRHHTIAWEHARDSSSGWLGIYYGYEDTFLRKLVVWSHLYVQSFLDPYLLWAGLLAILIGCAWLSRRTDVRPLLMPLAPLCLLQVAMVLVTGSMQIAVNSRFILALIPATAILFLRVCAILPTRILAALALVAAIQWVHINAAALGITPPLSDQSEWLRPMQTDGTRRDEIARLVEVVGAKPGEAPRLNLAAINTWFNINTLDFYDARRRLLSGGVSTRYMNMGWVQPDVEAAWRRIEDGKPPYVITAEEALSAPYHIFNAAAKPALLRMRSDARFIRVPFPSREGLLIFRFQP